jgi:hypothetical protein
VSCMYCYKLPVPVEVAWHSPANTIGQLHGDRVGTAKRKFQCFTFYSLTALLRLPCKQQVVNNQQCEHPTLCAMR